MICNIILAMHWLLQKKKKYFYKFSLYKNNFLNLQLQITSRITRDLHWILRYIQTFVNTEEDLFEEL